MAALPSQINYADAPLALPDDVVSRQIALSPVNGGSFVPGGLIQFDFLNMGYIVPDSLFIRYKYAFTNVVAAEMCGLPYISPFSRCETLIGSTVYESIQQYSQVVTMNSNLYGDIGNKYGIQSASGYNDSTSVPSLEQLDGRLLTVSETGTFSGVLPCLLSNCNKLVPAGMMPNIRVQLTLDQLSNYFTTTVAVPTALTLTNVELCYTSITSPTFDAAVHSMGPTLSMKSLSFFNSATTLASGTSGQVSLVYNQRLASIKAAFIMFCGQGATSLNKQFDSYDPTSSSGDVSITVAGSAFPQRPLSYVNNKAGILMALRSACGSIYDKANSMSINSVEFGKSGIAATSYSAPAKCIIGIPLERFHGGLLSGVSSQNSAITVNLNTATATPQGYSVNLVCVADVIITVDTTAGQVFVRQ